MSEAYTTMLYIPAGSRDLVENILPLLYTRKRSLPIDVYVSFSFVSSSVAWTSPTRDLGSVFAGALLSAT